MQPIEGYGYGRGRAYGAPAGPWHQVYDGRGDVQLTWEANYRKATARLRALGVLRADEDLERAPALAMRSDVAAAIMFYGMLEAGSPAGSWRPTTPPPPTGSVRAASSMAPITPLPSRC